MAIVEVGENIEFECDTRGWSTKEVDDVIMVDDTIEDEDEEDEEDEEDNDKTYWTFAGNNPIDNYMEYQHSHFLVLEVVDVQPINEGLYICNGQDEFSKVPFTARAKLLVRG